MDGTSLGLYLHIPFCRSKCTYCDFYSLPRAEDRQAAYTDALVRHMAALAPRAAGYTVDTIYFGGGTPSCLGAERLCRLLAKGRSLYSVAEEAEITLEANPDSFGDAAQLVDAGFNRVSLGVQSAHAEELRMLGRPHTFVQAVDAVQNARRGGFTNLSLDLIYGLPGQTMSRWQETLERSADLEPEHLSCYGLKLEEGTPLWRVRKTLTFPDDDLQADMYLWAVERLAARGYVQYEISNFARPGRESRHNGKYWALETYLGFGPGAHSDFGDIRYAYVRDLDAYLRGVQAGDIPLSEKTAISRQERAREYLMLGLRTAHGVAREEFENRYGCSFSPVARVLDKFRTGGWTVQTPDGRVRLTPPGFLVSNPILVEVLTALDASLDASLDAF